MTNLMLPLFEDTPPKDIPSLQASALNCSRCRLHQTRTQVTWGAGDIHSPLMVVAMGPSVSDDQTGGVYTGPAGEELDGLLAEAGLNRQMIYLTNAHKCVARAKDDPYNIRTPTKTELVSCKIWLDAEFAAVSPKILVCIGSPTAKWLLGEDFDLTKQRGEWVTGPAQTRALATFQPTYLTRLQVHDPELAVKLHPLVVGDFRRAAEAAGLIATSD